MTLVLRSRPTCVCHKRHVRDVIPYLNTDAQIHHKKGLEERLAEVEQALRIFSQRRVLVRSDDADDANCA